MIPLSQKRQQETLPCAVTVLAQQQIIPCTSPLLPDSDELTLLGDPEKRNSFCLNSEALGSESNTTIDSNDLTGMRRWGGRINPNCLDSQDLDLLEENCVDDNVLSPVIARNHGKGNTNNYEKVLPLSESTMIVGQEIGNCDVDVNGGEPCLSQEMPVCSVMLRRSSRHTPTTVTKECQQKQLLTACGPESLEMPEPHSAKNGTMVGLNSFSYHLN